MKINNIDLEKYFPLAWEQADRSQCLKKKVGAVLVEIFSGTIMGEGYGGAVEPCKECIRKTAEWSQDGCWSIHSEVRALFNHFSNYGYNENLSSHIMVVTHGPCDQCLKYMNYFKVPLVVYDKEYHTDYSKWEGKIKTLQRSELDEFNLLSI